MRSIRLVPNRSGKFMTWERGGYKSSNISNSRNRQLITNSDYDKKEPVYVPKVTEPYGNYALFEIEKGDIILQYNYEPKAYTVISLYNNVVLTNYMMPEEYFENKVVKKFDVDLYNEYAKGILSIPDKKFISIKHNNKWLLVNTKYYDYVEVDNNDIEFIENFALCAKLMYHGLPNELKEAVESKDQYGYSKMSYVK